MLPSTTPTQRLEMYEDALELVTVGFLSVPVLLADELNLAIRTLSESDLFLVQQRTAFASETEFQRWMLATATWMVDGQVLLGDFNAAKVCFKGYQALRHTQLERLYSVLSMLLARQRRSVEIIEAFCLEPISRNMWRQTGGHYPSNSFTGLPIESVGMNFAQKMWLAHNRMEDLRERIEQDWAHAKLIASATSPKGVEQLNAKESALKEADKTRKQELLDRVYYKWVGYLREDGTTAASHLPTFRHASTPDELADEMRRWVAGEKDYHDQVVDSYKQSVLDAYEREMEARRQRVAEVQQNLEEEGEDPEAIKLVGYTLDQLRDRIQPALHKTVYEAPKGATYLHDRYLAHAPDAGTLTVQGGKLMAKEAPPEASLGEQVANRRVEYGTGKG